MLVAEDDDSLRGMLELVLQREGYEVIACSDGARAREALRAAVGGAVQLSAVLLDLRMPRASGAEILETIRSEPVLRSLPVIAMSGHSDALQAQRAREAGADAFLAKPFSVDQLTAQLRSVLGGAQPS